MLPPITFSNAHIRCLNEPLSLYYRLSCAIPKGSSQIVKAEYVSTGQLCIIKVFPKPQVTSLSKSRRKLKSFAEIVANMDHPNIVRVFEVMEDADNFYVVTEALMGGSLADLIATNSTLTESQAACILQQILSALIYCHNMNIPHKNINLTNVMLREALSSASPSIALVGFGEKFSISKTPEAISCFLAPELFTNHPVLQSDLWSCGVVLYTLLSCSPPFTSFEYIKLMHKRRKDFLHYPSDNWDNISPSAISLISALIAWEPDARPTAVEAYNHAWIQTNAEKLPKTSKPIRNLLKTILSTHIGSALKEAVKRFVVFRIKNPKENDEESKHFKALDTNGDGMISREELLVVLKRIMPDMKAEEEADRIIKAADINSNGLLDFSEFLISSYREKDLLSTPNLATVFNNIDRDYSGTISIEEMKTLFYFSGSTDKDRVWRELMEITNKETQKEIYFEEFCEVIRKTE